jgi:hypothetical protein
MAFGKQPKTEAGWKASKALSNGVGTSPVHRVRLSQGPRCCAGSHYSSGGGERLESLEPQPRKDRGRGRALDAECEEAVITLRKENPGVSLPVFLRPARSRGIFPAERTPSNDSLYRLVKRHGLDKDTRLPEDRRKFETEPVNDLWQSDCMHGPRVIHEGKIRKTHLVAVIDDPSRLITDDQLLSVRKLRPLSRLSGQGA